MTLFPLGVFIPVGDFAGPRYCDYVFPTVLVEVFDVSEEVVGVTVCSARFALEAGNLLQGTVWFLQVETRFRSSKLDAFLEGRPCKKVRPIYDVAVSVLGEVGGMSPFRPELVGETNFFPFVVELILAEN